MKIQNKLFKLAGAAVMAVALQGCSGTEKAQLVAGTSALEESANLTPQSTERRRIPSSDPGYLGNGDPQLPQPGRHQPPQPMDEEKKEDYQAVNGRPQYPPPVPVPVPVPNYPEPPKCNELPHHPEPRALACDYKEYPGRINEPDQSECHWQALQTLGTGRNGDEIFSFSMYNATNLSHGWVLGAQGLSGDRFITYQNVYIDQSKAPGSISLELKSYEPVRWQIIGNVAAVKAVQVTGYHCAVVTGVDPRLVSIATYEGSNGNTVNLSGRQSSSIDVYEGSCMPKRTFTVN